MIETALLIANILSVWYLFYAIHILRKIFLYNALWQLKEYRRDRFIAFFKTKEGKKFLLTPSFILKVIVFISFLILSPIDIPLFSELFILSALFFALLYIILGVRDFWGGLMKTWKRPKLTPKSILVLLFSLLLILSVFFFIYKNESIHIYIGLLGLDFSVGLIVSVFVLFMSLPTSILKKRIVSIATKKINNYKNLIVIGITGSVGKTSTKEFLAKILEAKYKIQKTPESINTQIGIAKYILSDLKDDTEVFIVEMGAYKKGEIKEICDIVHPKIGIITYIGSQHLELFGNLQNLIDAKYELIESLPKDGLAIFNEENNYSRDLSKEAKEEGKKVLLFGQDKINIKQYPAPNLLGKQTIPNLLAAITVAEVLHIPVKQIQNQILHIKPPSHTMELVGKYKGATLIDDTFNASQESVLSALEYMTLYKGKKILILSPLIELGSQSQGIKNEVLTKAGQICNLVFLTNKDSLADFKEKIERLVNKDSVIVFEGKESMKYLKLLKV